mgnify:CR=1 FL=1
MASLTNTKIKNTYVSLLKVADNGQLDAALQDITDGAGNTTGIQLNTGGDLTASGTVSFGSLKDSGENITITKFVDAADGIGSNDNDTTIPTSAAVSAYVASQVTLEDLDFAGDSGTGSVDLDSQTLTIQGTANEIVTAAGAQTLTIGLPSTINVNVQGDLTGNVTATSVLVDGVTATTQSIGDNSTKVATTAYVDAAITAEGLDFAGDAGSGTIDLDSETFTIAGTANEIETNATGNTLTVGLPSNVTIGNDLTVTGDLNVDSGTLFVDSTSNEVGINITNPQADLHVVNAGNVTLRLETSGTTDSSAVQFGDADNANVGRVVYDHSADAMLLYTSNSEQVRIDSSGNVGIGTSSPSVKLDVTGDITSSGTVTGTTLTGTLSTAAQPNITSVGTLSSLAVSGDVSIADKIVHTGDTNTAIRFPSADTVTVETAGSERMRIDSSGNVGIGTSSPTTNLYVNGVSAGGQLNALSVVNDNYTADTSESVAIQGLVKSGSGAAAVSGRIVFGKDDTFAAAGNRDGNIQFYTNTDNSISEKMRIDSSGNVGIGTSSPDTLLHLAKNQDPELKFEATDTSILQGQSLGTISWYSNDGSSGGVGERAFITSTAENSGTQYNLSFGTGSGVDATEKMRLDDNGYLRLYDNGIQFNGETAAGNALDDYEEGNFTPEVADAVSGGNTGSGTLNGYYTKIGRQVTVAIQATNIVTTGMTAGNDFILRNLPFPSSDLTGTPFFVGSIDINSLNIGTTFSSCVAFVPDGDKSFVQIQGQRFDGGNSAIILVSDINSGSTDFRMTITYFTDL